jgi:methylated-DNA-[protein]-cysteine S-methyltransferase
MPRLPLQLAYTYVETPIGSLLVAGDDHSVHLISFPEGGRSRKPEPNWREEHGAFVNAIEEIRAYFAGEISRFSINLTMTGTEFQKSVWRALMTIPFGQTASYGEIAKRIGLPSASRAVGAANGANPLPIVVPCHRVIGANGSLTGFGGGLPVKQFLLDHERGVKRLL